MEIDWKGLRKVVKRKSVPLKDLLRGIYFLKTFSDSELAKIEPLREKTRYGPGTVIFQEGDEASAVFLVEIGTVKIAKDSGAVEITTIWP